MNMKTPIALLAYFISMSATLSVAGPVIVVESFGGFQIPNGASIPDLVYTTDFGKVAVSGDECLVELRFRNAGDSNLFFTGPITTSGDAAADFSPELQPSTTSPISPN